MIYCQSMHTRFKPKRLMPCCAVDDVDVFAPQSAPALALEAAQQPGDDFAHRAQFVGQSLVRQGQVGAPPQQRSGQALVFLSKKWL